MRNAGLAGYLIFVVALCASRSGHAAIAFISDMQIPKNQHVDCNLRMTAYTEEWGQRVADSIKERYGQSGGALVDRVFDCGDVVEACNTAVGTVPDVELSALEFAKYLEIMATIDPNLRQVDTEECVVPPFQCAEWALANVGYKANSAILRSAPGNHDDRSGGSTVQKEVREQYERVFGWDFEFGSKWQKVTTSDGINVIGLFDAPSYSSADSTALFNLLNNDGGPTIVYCHAPFFTGNQRVGPSSCIEFLSTNPKCDLLVPMFEATQVDLVVTGHAHDYERFSNNGVMYLVIGGAGVEQVQDDPSPDTPITAKNTMVRGLLGGDLFHHWAYVNRGAGDELEVEIIRIDKDATGVTTSFVFDSFVVTPEYGYENLSQNPGLGISFSEPPYAVVAFRYDNDTTDDLLASFASNAPLLFRFRRNHPVTGDPEYLEDTSEAQLVSAGSKRGITIADIDNDGDPDIFMAGETDPRLYTMDAAGPAPVFTDASTSSGIAALATNSVAGAWGDYDRDGQIDLFVVRSTGDPTPATIVAESDRLLRNSLGVFSDASGVAGIDASAKKTVCASWNDINGDGMLDLFVGSMGTASLDPSEMYLNDGDGTFTSIVQAPTGPTIAAWGWVSGVAWMDLNGDQADDIVLTRHQDPAAGSPTNNLVICLNDGFGSLINEPDIDIDESVAELDGVLRLDYNLDGFDDLLAAQTANARPLVYGRVGGASEVRVESAAFMLNIPAGAIGGMVQSDFDQDGDHDLLLGRASGFYLRNRARNSNSSPNWLGVRLVAPHGGNNRSGLGARVLVEAPPTNPILVQARTIDGGTGRGSQESATQFFGLGQLENDVKVTVSWTDGYSQSQSFSIAGGQLNQIQEVTEVPHAPGLLGSTFDFFIQPLPGQKMDMVARWESIYASDPSKLSVSMNFFAGAGCTNIGQNRLAFGDPNVVTSVTPLPSGRYLNEVRWNDRNCESVCFYKAFDPSCAMGLMASTPSSGTVSKRISVSVCLQ